MKNLLKAIILQLAFLHFGGNLFAQSLNPDDLTVVMEKIQQYSAPLRTLEFEFVEERERNGKLEPKKRTYRVKIDFQKNLARWEAFFPASETFPYDVWNYQFFDNGVLTSIGTSKKKSSKTGEGNLPVTNVGIRRYISPFSTSLEVIIQHNALLGPSRDSPKPEFHILYNGKFPFVDPEIKDVMYNGEPSIEVHQKSVLDKGKLKLVFSKRTGALLKKASYSVDSVDGKIVDRFLNSYNYSNFTVYKGILFPLKMILEYSNPAKAHITIKKESLRINEPIDKNEFIPKIPGGANVHDEIKGIEYTTSILGNLEATKELEKELDAYFKSADDVK